MESRAEGLHKKKRKHMNTPKHTKGEWRQFPKHELIPDLGKDNTYRSIVSGKGYYDKKTKTGFDLTGYISEADANLIASAPKLLQRIQDLEQGILRFQAHLEEMGGNYTQDELWKMINLVTVDRPYFPPVEYHDNWSGTAKTTEHD